MRRQNNEPLYNPYVSINDHAEGSSMEGTLQKEVLLEVIERFDVAPTNDLEAAQNIDFIGVFAGVKSAALIQFDYENRFSTTATSLGYIFEPIGNSYGLARTEADFKILKESYTTMQENIHNPGKTIDEAERTLGKVLGYPETSTEYYLERAASYVADNESPDFALPFITPLSTHDTVSANFHSFILSPDHYAEELEAYAKPLEEATQALLPNTYDYLEKRVRQKRIDRRLARALGPLYKRKEPVDDIEREYVA